MSYNREVPKGTDSYKYQPQVNNNFEFRLNLKMNNQEKLLAVKRQMSQYKYLKHDEIIDSASSKFQIVAFASCLIAFSMEGFLVYNLAYLNLLPIYNCFSEDGTSSVCHRQQTC